MRLNFGEEDLQRSFIAGHGCSRFPYEGIMGLTKHIVNKPLADVGYRVGFGGGLGGEALTLTASLNTIGRLDDKLTQSAVFFVVRRKEMRENCFTRSALKISRASDWFTR